MSAEQDSSTPRVVWHSQSVQLHNRILQQGHRSGIVWLTGLSGSGKSTIANELDSLLFNRTVRSFLLDGDNVRHGLCATAEMMRMDHNEEFARRFGLGFQAIDREENIRRVGAAAGLLVAAGVLVITAFVSPYRCDRERVRAMTEKEFGQGSFVEVFIDTPLEICEERDPKGLYKQARAGKILNFTGISDPYEAPAAAEIVIDDATLSPSQAATRILEYLEQKKWFKTAA